MNAHKPKESLAGQACPCCAAGHFVLAQTEYIAEIPDDNPVTIHGIWVDRCDSCGEIVYPGETTRFIESVVAEQTEQLTPRELERIREDLGVATQDEMSEALGLGLKTYHKWESGKQYPTRSMSYYIRVLAEFPQAFDWLRRRAWRSQNRLTHPQAQADFAAMFPDLDLARTGARPSITPNTRRPNPALGLTRTVFHVK